jgi:hypothetical protein
VRNRSLAKPIGGGEHERLTIGETIWEPEGVGSGSDHDTCPITYAGPHSRADHRHIGDVQPVAGGAAGGLLFDHQLRR